MVYWFKYKHWRLPLFFVVLLILLCFFISIYPSFLEKEQNRIAPTTSFSTPSPVASAPAVGPHEPTHPIDRQKENRNKEKKKSHPEIKEKPKEIGNVSHFRDALTDRLKIEGMDSQIGDQIFHHIRAQLGRTSFYDVEESVRAVLPDLSDQDVYKMRELILQVADESFKTYYGHQ